MIKWLDNNQIQIDKVPKKPLKITGTRFGAILGLNRWNTPFKTWCEITKTYKEEFEDNMYTIAGKIIEPKVADYLKQEYLMDSLVTPTDVFGENYFARTHGDFYPLDPVFGGMWDFLDVYPGGKVRCVIEVKTTSRAGDWVNDIPEYYALQGALYAYKLGTDDVVMVVCMLEDEDYEHPEDFICSSDNTSAIGFKISQRYPNFEAMMHEAETWYNEHVLTGISPVYDEKKDADILKILRTRSLSSTTNIDELLEEAEKLYDEIGVYKEGIKEKEDRLDVVKALLKEYSVEQFKDGDKYTVLEGSRYKFVTTKTITKSVDKEKLKADGLYDTYEKLTEGYKFDIKPLG